MCTSTLATTVDGRSYPPPRADYGRRRDGCTKIAPNEIYLLADVPDSFDSRAFGPVPLGNTIGVYEPLWTF